MSFGDDIAVWLPQLRRYARALTGDAAWADDLVQDAAERAIVQGKRLPAGSQARAWMLTVLRHLYIDQLRRRREVAVDAADPLWQRQAARASEIDGLLLRDVQRALYRLPVEQREVLLLIVLEGLRYQEAAEVLQVPLGTVMSRLSRAREHLRALLADGAGGSGGTGGAGGTGGTDGTGERHVPLRVVRNTP